MRTQIYIPKTQLDQLREIARKNGTTVSETVRFFIYGGLREIKKTKPKKAKIQSLLKTAEEIKAMGAKGPRDLAGDTDKYLYGPIN